MKYLEEDNKNLISLRTSLITNITLLTGGLVGIIIADINFILKVFLLIFGLYFEVLFINNMTVMNKRINQNIGAMKDECK